jgi:murein DD-endopeptidase MepM/ murein hydrolase activator NlpD
MWKIWVLLIIGLLLPLTSCGSVQVIGTTLTPIPTATPYPILTYALSGIIFFDYDGNGKKDEGEPPIEAALLTVGDNSDTSDINGSYFLDSLSDGKQSVYIRSPSQEPQSLFRYISISLQAFQTIDQPLLVSLNGDMRLDIGLMQGYLTLPYAPKTTIVVLSYDDLQGNNYDNRVRDWQGNTKMRLVHDGKDGFVYDYHCGIDYGMGENAELCDMDVYSAAPGKVVSISPVNEQGGGSVRLLHMDGRMTDYAHLEKIFVEINQSVQRGELLGTTYCSWNEPHLHFELMGMLGEGKLQWGFWRLPIYRDPLNSNSFSYWTKDNNPQFSSEYRP